MDTILPILWFGIIGFGVVMYVLMDGFVSVSAISRPSPRANRNSIR